MFFVIFTFSERHERKVRAADENIEQFRVAEREDLDNTAIAVRPGNVLVAVRDCYAGQHTQEGFCLLSGPAFPAVAERIAVEDLPGLISAAARR